MAPSRLPAVPSRPPVAPSRPPTAAVPSHGPRRPSGHSTSTPTHGTVFPPPDGNQGNEFLAAAVSSSLNLPSFWLERPHTWFAMCESTFAVRQITSPITKYHHCVSKLPQETVASIEDVVNNFTAFNDPYRELKERLCRAYGRTDQQKVNDLLDLPPLGVEKPCRS